MENQQLSNFMKDPLRNTACLRFIYHIIYFLSIYYIIVLSFITLGQ